MGTKRAEEIGLVTPYVTPSRAILVGVADLKGIEVHSIRSNPGRGVVAFSQLETTAIGVAILRQNSETCARGVGFAVRPGLRHGEAYRGVSPSNADHSLDALRYDEDPPRMAVASCA